MAAEFLKLNFSTSFCNKLDHLSSDQAKLISEPMCRSNHEFSQKSRNEDQ